MEPEPEPAPEFPVGFRCERGIVLTSPAPWGPLPPAIISGKETLAQHRKTWDQVYVPWCDAHGRDPLRYDIAQVANFLESEQQRFQRGQESRGVAHNHAGFKDRRAAVAAMLKLVYPHLPRVSDHEHIRVMAEQLSSLVCV